MSAFRTVVRVTNLVMCTVKTTTSFVTRTAFGTPPCTERMAQSDRRSAVVVFVAGEVDASNERAWAQVVSEPAATVTAPGPFIIRSQAMRHRAR